MRRSILHADDDKTIRGTANFNSDNVAHEGSKQETRFASNPSKVTNRVCFIHSTYHLSRLNLFMSTVDVLR